MSSINLERTCDATASSGYSNKWTFSAWVKRGLIGTEQGLFANKRTDNNTNSRFRFRIKSTNKLCWEIKDSGGSDDSSFETNMLFRDTNAWYHIVFIYDSDNSTETDRMKCYVNGKDVRTELGGFSSINEVGSGFGSLWSSSVKNYLGVSHDNSGNPYRWDGLMSHVHFTYGQRYEASTFGETDSTTGEWKIKTDPSVTYGSQGFWLFKDNASVTDQSGEGNNYTLNAGTLTKTEDNPSNVFCTMNPLMNYSNGTPTFAQGNTVINGSGSAWLRTSGTLANRTGKFYYEAYLQAYYGSGRPIRIGWDSIDYPRTGAETYYSGFNISSDGFIRGGIKGYNNYDPNATALGVTLAQGDYVGLAIDLDNDLVTCYKNGTVISNVNGLDISGNSNCSIINSKGYQVTPSLNFYTVNTNDNEIYFNFGNGAFGSTQLTGTTYNDSQGNGVFKYQPPTNYLCWSTKSFNV